MFEMVIRVAVPLFCLSLYAQQYNCKDFMVLDRISSSSEYAVYERVQDLVCSSDVGDASSATTLGVKASIPIPVLQKIFALDFGGTFSGNNAASWKRQFCKSHYSEVAAQLKTADLSETFSDNAAKVIQDCIRAMAIYGYFEPTPDGSRFSFKFHSQGRDALTGGNIKPGDEASDCDHTNPFSLKKVGNKFQKKDISGNPAEFGCAWSNNKPVQVTVSTENNGTRVYTLNPIPMPKAEALSPPAPPIRNPPSLRVTVFPRGQQPLEQPGAAWAGTTTPDGAHNIDKFSIRFEPAMPDLHFKYRCAGANIYGKPVWSKYVEEGAECKYEYPNPYTAAPPTFLGPILMFEILLDGADSSHWQVEYKCYSPNYNTFPAKGNLTSGATCGTDEPHEDFITAVWVSVKPIP